MSGKPTTSMQRIVEVLRLAVMRGDGPMSATQLAHAVEASKKTVNIMIARLKVMKVVRVSEWTHVDVCHVIPLYALGNAPDADKPKAKTKAEVARASRERKAVKKERTAEASFELDRKRKAAIALAQPSFRHPQDIALFGEYRRAA